MCFYPAYATPLECIRDNEMLYLKKSRRQVGKELPRHDPLPEKIEQEKHYTLAMFSCA